MDGSSPILLTINAMSQASVESPRLATSPLLVRPLCCPWSQLLRVPRAALSLPVLVLALAGSLTTTAGWQLIEKVLVAPADRDLADVRALGSWPGSGTLARSIGPRDGADGFLPQNTPRFLAQAKTAPDDPLTSLPYRMTAPVWRVFSYSVQPQAPRSYYLAGWLWTVLVWSYFGTAITRMAVVRFGKQERLGLSDAVACSHRMWKSQMGAMILPMCGAALLAAPMALLGGLMRWDWGAGFAGLVWGLVLVDSILLGLFVLGMLFAWPLMWGAVATEQSDAFDAISRSYAYLFQRPANYFVYCVVAIVVGMCGWVLVWGGTASLLWLAYGGISWGSGNDRLAQWLADPTWIHGWNRCLITLASAYAHAFVWCAAAVIYLLMRYDVDQTEWDEVHGWTDPATDELPNLAPAVHPQADGPTPNQP